MKITFEVDAAAAAAPGFVVRRLDATNIRTLLRVPDDFGADGNGNAPSTRSRPSCPQRRPSSARRKTCEPRSSNDDRNGRT